MIADIIKARKSVRTFDGHPLREADRAKLATFIEKIDNPFGVPVEFRLLDAKAHGLSSPVIVGAEQYVAAKAARAPGFELACGYSFERFCLFAASLGLGTVMLAATLSRDAFEKAMELQGAEVMPVASPVGYPAVRRSVRAGLMRKAIRADERLPFGMLFFSGGFERPLSPDEAGMFREALEMARLAPSAANKQPWRAVVAGNAVHFLESKSMKDSPLGDIQRLDVGIALAHFELTLREAGTEGKFVSREPGIALPENVRYVISYEAAP